LADVTANPQDEQMLRQSADDFDAEAELVESKRRAASERRKDKL
jgi:hypothetical protein